MTVVLAADTTTPINTVALCRDDVLLAESTVDCRRLHSERLLATVDWVLAESGLTLRDVELLAISIGPGSFTGLRIGVATWKGLALGCGLPLVGVPALDAMTRLGMFEDTIACPLIDARMSEVFGALYRFADGRREKIGPDRVCPVESILEAAADLCAEKKQPCLFFGDGAHAYRDRILTKTPAARIAPAWWGVPHAAAVAMEAQHLQINGAPTDPAQVFPVYLRMSQPEEKRKRLAEEAAS